MTEIFVLCSGQEDNIGDVVLRRALLTALRPYGTLHIYLSSASQNFTEALELSPHDVVYRTMKSWRSSAYGSARRSTIWFVDKPGELQMSARAVLAQLRHVPLTIAARLRGGRVLRLGIGQRHPRLAQKWALRAAFMFSDRIAWRDTASHQHFGIGQIMPDWGFRESSDATSADARERRRMVLSYRSDRPHLSAATISAIAQFAQEAGLELVVVTQVLRDEAAGAQLAEQLGAEFIGWPDSRSHAEQESLLREVYREASIVVSDRLHVLIVAATQGAIPFSIVSYSESKVARHFGAIGYPDMTLNTAGMEAHQIVASLIEQTTRQTEISNAVEKAVTSIDEIVDGLEPRTRPRSEKAS